MPRILPAATSPSPASRSPRLLARAIPSFPMPSLLTGVLVLAAMSCADGGAAADPGTVDRDAERSIPAATYVRIFEAGTDGAALDSAAALAVSGVVVSDGLARPSSKVGGVLSAVLVDAGDDVRRGQVIARIDATELVAGVAEAEAGLAKARRDLARAEALLADSVATRTQRDDAATAVALAERQLERLRYNRDQDVIASPISGRILEKLANAGETVGPGQPVVVVQGTAASDWRVRVGLTDAQWAGVEVGQAAEVRFDAFPGEGFAARLVERATAADRASGTFPVEFALREQPPSLAAGLVADVTLAPTAGAAAESEPGTLRIPVAALGRVAGKRAEVFVLDGGRARGRDVRLGSLRGGMAEVLGGLGAGDSVITTGVAWLRDGDAVVVAPGSQ